MTFVAPNLACGEARGGRIPCHGAVTDEQRSHRPNSTQPGGRQVFFAQTSLLAPHRSTAGYAPRSRLVCAKNPLPRTSSYLCLRPLRAGFMEKERLFPTTAGTPQGGIASPALANLTLDGLEPAIRAAIQPRRDKVNFIRYADDFVVTAASKQILEQKVKPV